MTAALFDIFGEPEPDAYPPPKTADDRQLDAYHRACHSVAPRDLGAFIGSQVWICPVELSKFTGGGYYELVSVTTRPFTTSPYGGILYTLHVRDTDGAEYSSTGYMATNRVSVKR